MDQLNAIIEDFFKESTQNYVSEDIALSESVIGMKMFDTPIYGVAPVEDEIFKTYETKDEILYKKFRGPKAWLKEGVSVVSIFLPYSQEVKKGNAKDFKKPSVEWLHGRYEGQLMILELSKYIQKRFQDLGFKCVFPCLESDMISHTGTREVETRDDLYRLTNRDFWSNWSERHVAYAAGLGTFGLSKNIITRKGAAGRFTSFITDMTLEPTPRSYTGLYDNCNECGACIRNCPVNTISFEEGKKHLTCSRYIDWVYDKHTPRYACGKCQVAVDCQDGIPQKSL